MTITNEKIQFSLKDQLKPMSPQQLMKECPNIFNTNPIETASDKYTVINVWEEVILPLQKHGWFVHKTKATHSKYKEKATFMVHMANQRFSNKERATEIIIMSSHDKRTPLQFRMGVVEFICSNGLFVVTEEIEELRQIKIRHKGDVEEKLNLVMKIIERETLKLDDLFEKMKGVKLSKDAQRKLAEKALELHGVTAKADFDLELAIRTSLQTAVDAEGKPIPTQDGDSLFNVFQRIQGNIMKGKAKYRLQNALKKAQKNYDHAELMGDEKEMKKLSKKISKIENDTDRKYRSVTKLTNIKKVAAFNEGLFEEAVSMVNEPQFQLQ